MSYTPQKENKSPRNHAFTDRNRNNVCILSIGIKEAKPAQQVLKAISSQQLIVKCNRVHVVTARRDKDIIRTNLQENRYISTKPEKYKPLVTS